MSGGRVKLGHILANPAHLFAWLCLLSGLLLVGCSNEVAVSEGDNDATANNSCVDNDGDGFGEGCAAGLDCDDSNSAVQVCDCESGDYAGCSCDGDQTITCFEGLPEQADVGACRSGTRQCENGEWSACVGQITPTREVCNDIDDDCDGDTDEDVDTNPCGNCDETCSDEGVGVDEANDWDLGEDSSGIAVNDRGGLELTTDDSRFDFVYIANSDEGTLSKLDARTGDEVARYISARRVDDDMPSNPAKNCPSRTAVDLRGNVWVANRAFEYRGSVTKIGHRDCLDGDDDGESETSHDADSNGRINRNDSNEFFGEADECILFTVTVGGVDGIPRALAIDPFNPRGIGSVWVGNWNEQRYYQLEADDGELVNTVDVPHRPYGAVMDSQATLWSATKLDAEHALVSIDAETAEVTGVYGIESRNGCANSYGVSIDRDDNVWLAGRECGCAFRYTPSTGQWMTVDFGVPGAKGRGITADRDGWVYVGISNNSQGTVGQIARFRSDDGSQLNVFNATPDGKGTIGVGMDYEGRVWGVNRSTDNAVRLDPQTGSMQFFPVGNGPYTYSDFTGYTLRNFTAPQGSYYRVFTGCPQRETAKWHKLFWEADQPAGTEVYAFVKTADTIGDLVTATRFGPFESSPADLRAAGVPDGRYLEVEMVLASDEAGISPILWSVSVAWSCPPVL